MRVTHRKDHVDEMNVVRNKTWTHKNGVRVFVTWTRDNTERRREMTDNNKDGGQKNTEHNKRIGEKMGDDWLR